MKQGLRRVSSMGSWELSWEEIEGDDRENKVLLLVNLRNGEKSWPDCVVTFVNRMLLKLH